VEAAYRRGDLFAKRRALMKEWARFCAQPVTADNVVELRRGRPTDTPKKQGRHSRFHEQHRPQHDLPAPRIPRARDETFGSPRHTGIQTRQITVGRHSGAKHLAMSEVPLAFF